MPFWSKKNKNGDKPQKRESLSDTFRRAAERLRRLSLRDLGKMTRHTLSDLKQPKEAGGLVIAIIIPGGMFGWFVYRIEKYRRRHIANDNRPSAADTVQKPQRNRPAEKPKSKKPKKPKPPAA